MISSESAQKHVSESGIYKSLFENHPDAVYVVDHDGRFLDLNPMARSLIGYTTEELVGMSFTQLVLPVCLDAVCHHFHLVKQGEPQNYETTVVHKDGHHIEIQVTNAPLIVKDEIAGVFGIAKDITEQKHMHFMLEERKQRYESLLRYNAIGVCSLDLNGNLIEVNPAFERMTGYTALELSGMKYSEVLFPGDAERADKTYVSGELLENVEIKIRHKSGECVCAQATSVPFAMRGETCGFYVLLRDVTDQKREHDELLETQRLFQLISENSQDVISYTTPDGVFRYISPSVTSVLGYTPEEVIGKTYTDFFHEDDHANILNLSVRVVHGENINRHIGRIRHKNGEYLWFETTLQISRGPHGEMLQTLGVGRDVTELVRNRDRYQRLVDNSLDGIGVVEAGKWLFMNRTGLELLGAEREEQIVGRNCHDFLHPDHHEEFQGRVQSMMSGELVDVVEQKWIRVNGEVIHAEVKGIPFDDKAVQLIIRDVTEQKRSNDLLLRNEKLSSVGQLAAGVAHEIRNPLTALKGFTQLLSDRARGPKRRYFEIMEGELERIEMILNELLILAKPQAVTYQPQDLVPIIQEVITLLGTQAIMRNAEIITDLGEVKYCVNCVESQLKQVFVNVIKNALEAMPNGGKLQISLKMHRDQIQIRFADDGEGIPEEHISKLGEPFYTTKEKGTGLGLMMSHKIILAHQGNIDISSEVGKGTTVDIFLPVHRPVKHS